MLCSALIGLPLFGSVTPYATGCFIGTVTKVNSNGIQVRENGHEVQVVVPAGTVIWKGEIGKQLSNIHVGDSVDVGYFMHNSEITAVRLTVNEKRLIGVVISKNGLIFRVQSYPDLKGPSGYEHRVFKVEITRRTHFISGEESTILPGKRVEVNGLGISDGVIEAIDIFVNSR